MNAHAVVAASARAVIPLAALFAFALLAESAPGDGVGFRAGLAFALVIAIHMLAFGARAAREALPLGVARVLLALGVLGVAGGEAARGYDLAARIVEGGLFLTTAAASALVLGVIVGRAPTLRDEE